MPQCATTEVFSAMRMPLFCARARKNSLAKWQGWFRITGQPRTKKVLPKMVRTTFETIPSPNANRASHAPTRHETKFVSDKKNPGVEVALAGSIITDGDGQ